MEKKLLQQEITNYTSKINTLKQMSLQNEYWKEIEGTNGRYHISNQGRLATLNHHASSLNLGKVAIMKPSQFQGYLRTSIKIKGKQKHVSIHRLVAKYFWENPHNKPQVNHINHNRSDNRAENLEWVTHRENVDHMMKHGRQTVNNGQKNGMSKLTESMVLEIRNKYQPYVVMAKDLAKEYNVSTAAVKDLLRGRTWKHIG